MFWLDWDGYIDANLEDWFTKGDGTKGDGIFNDMRWFFDSIPEMCKKMASEMWFKGAKAKEYTDKMSQTIYEKNIGGVHRLMTQAKFNSEAQCSYYNVSAMILGMADIRPLTDGGASQEKDAVFADWELKMKEVDAKAKSIAADTSPNGWFAASIEYRTKMWKYFEKVVTKRQDLRKQKLGESEQPRNSKKTSPKDTPKEVADILAETETWLRINAQEESSLPQTGHDGRTYSGNVPESHGQGQWWQWRWDDDDTAN